MSNQDALRAQLLRSLRATDLSALMAMLEQLRQAPASATIELGTSRGLTFTLHRDLAFELINRLAVARQIRAAAESENEPTPNSYGDVNISSWVGVHTPAWHTVYSYSSPDPRTEPWFCSLDTDAQRIALLLVAHDLESGHLRRERSE